MQRLFLFASAMLFCGALSAQNWDVAVLFLGKAETQAYQRDIDRNILELARAKPNDTFHLSLYRELPKSNVTYFVEPQSKETHSWSSLFFTKVPKNIQIHGHLESVDVPEDRESIFAEPLRLQHFFKRAFTRKEATRLLVVYSHGDAYDGLGGGITLPTFRKSLETLLPKRSALPLDVLWLDSCFMANTEVAFELRKITPYLVASEEAEFSKGSPFEMLRILGDGPSNTLEVMQRLGELFIESYSYSKLGTQRKGALKSSATLSIIETKKIENLVAGLKNIAVQLRTLSSEEVMQLKRSSLAIHMEKTEVVDLGKLLLLLAEVVPNEVHALIESNRIQDAQSNPRVILEPVLEGQGTLFGYEAWTKGFKGDANTLSILPKDLKKQIDAWVRGSGDKSWPVLTNNKSLVLSPFSVGLNAFHYYTVDLTSGKPLSKTESVVRERDFVLFSAKHSQNPILFSGYTQGIGESAEKYLGLSILDPFIGLPSFDYPELEFPALTGWGSQSTL